MQDINWIQVGAGVLGGGAVGSVITNVWAALRNRKQPVGFRVVIIPVFKGGALGSDLPAKLTIAASNREVRVENLFVAEIQLVNRGNKDLQKLDMGFTLSNGDLAIHVICAPPDRYHKIKISNPINALAPASAVDFQLLPFNRGDTYNLKTYLVISSTTAAPGPISFGSSEPVIFTAMPTLTELAAEATSGLSLNVGPLRLSLRKDKQNTE